MSIEPPPAAPSDISGQSEPIVSVGLAVYNGERYLAEAIESILSQTFTDFELVISDNCSTDGTAEICARYAAADPRIRYHRNDSNIGGANNENLVFVLSRGRYFRGAAHDDVLEPDLLRRCVDTLEQRPDVVVCYTHSILIDEHGNEIGRLTRTIGGEATASERLRLLYLRGAHDCESSYGLMRSSALRRTDLQANYTDSDRTWLCQLALQGPFAVVPEFLFRRRIHPGRSTQVYRGWRERMAWFDPDAGSKIYLPGWMQLFHYIGIIRRSALPSRERWRCFAAIARWCVVETRWRLLANDVFLACIGTVRCLRARRRPHWVLVARPEHRAPKVAQ